MARKFRIVAVIEGDEPRTGDPIRVRGLRDYEGTITEVTPIMSAEDMLDEIYEIAKNARNGVVFATAIVEKIDSHRAVQKKPFKLPPDEDLTDQAVYK